MRAFSATVACIASWNAAWNVACVVTFVGCERTPSSGNARSHARAAASARTTVDPTTNPAHFAMRHADAIADTHAVLGEPPDARRDANGGADPWLLLPTGEATMPRARRYDGGAGTVANDAAALGAAALTGNASDGGAGLRLAHGVSRADASSAPSILPPTHDRVLARLDDPLAAPAAQRCMDRTPVGSRERSACLVHAVMPWLRPCTACARIEDCHPFVPDAWRACRTHSDCVEINVSGGVDACEGGAVVAVASSSSADFRARFSANECPVDPARRTHARCDRAGAACVRGLCTEP